jgi:hypothetical protein
LEKEGNSPVIIIGLYKIFLQKKISDPLTCLGPKAPGRGGGEAMEIIIELPTARQTVNLYHILSATTNEHGHYLSFHMEGFSGEGRRIHVKVEDETEVNLLASALKHFMTIWK